MKIRDFLFSPLCFFVLTCCRNPQQIGTPKIFKGLLQNADFRYDEKNAISQQSLQGAVRPRQTVKLSRKKMLFFPFADIFRCYTQGSN